MLNISFIRGHIYQTEKKIKLIENKKENSIQNSRKNLNLFRIIRKIKMCLFFV